MKAFFGRAFQQKSKSRPPQNRPPWDFQQRTPRGISFGGGLGLGRGCLGLICRYFLHFIRWRDRHMEQFFGQGFAPSLQFLWVGRPLPARTRSTRGSGGKVTDCFGRGWALDLCVLAALFWGLFKGKTTQSILHFVFPALPSPSAVALRDFLRHLPWGVQPASDFFPGTSSQGSGLPTWRSAEIKFGPAQ